MKAYLDIETSLRGEITIVGIFRPPNQMIQLIGDEVNWTNLWNALEGVAEILTYNGDRFDLPVIKRAINLDLRKYFECRDLMYDCWQKNLYGKVLPPILPAPGALPARTTIEVTTKKNWGWARLKELAPLHLLFSLMISGGLSGPGGEMLRAGQTVGAYLSAPLHFASAEREHKKHISLLQRWK